MRALFWVLLAFVVLFIVVPLLHLILAVAIIAAAAVFLLGVARVLFAPRASTIARTPASGPRSLPSP